MYGVRCSNRGRTGSVALLVIDLIREVPEAMKPKTVPIKTGAPLVAVEDQGNAKAA